MTHDIFISFSSADKDVAEEVYDVLAEKGFSCWISTRKIQPGTADWAAAIDDAIQSAKVFILVYSKNSNASNQVLNELHVADQNGLVIVPFKIDNTPYTQGLDYFLTRHQWLDATITPVRAHAEKLAELIPALLAGDPLNSKRLIRESSEKREPPTAGECPYKGLNFFNEEDAGIFFGREMLVAKLVGHLRKEHFLAVVVGASGSGKSSVIRAGMIPALRSGKPLADNSNPPSDSTNWPIFVVTPGVHPLDSLALALTKDSPSVTAADQLVQDLLQTPRALYLYISKMLKGTNKEALLFIDQFEELFTISQGQKERKAFVDNLLTATSEENAGVLRVVITLRADFYAHCAEFDDLRQAVSSHQEYIGRMSREEMRRAIEEPARQGKWLMEAGLVNMLLDDVGNEPGALPLLSHALMETWNRREGNWLTVRGYVESGGVRGAIAHTAESIYGVLSEEEKGFARKIFVNLTEIGEGTQDTRRRIPLQDLLSEMGDSPSVQKLLTKLSDARLLTIDENSVEVAHEALIREWPRLQEWLNEDRAGLMLHRRLSSDTHEWSRSGKDESLLYRGTRLAEASDYARTNPGELSAVEQEFVTASQRSAQKEAEEKELQRQKELTATRALLDKEKQQRLLQIKNTKIIRTIGIIAAIAAVVAVIFAVIATRQTIQANANVVQANNSLSRQLAVEALDLPFDLSLLLDKEALKINDSFAVRSSLISLFQKNADLIRYDRDCGSDVNSVAFNPKENILAAGCLNGSTFIYNITTREVSAIPNFDKSISVRTITFSPDGKILAVAYQATTTDGYILLWDLATLTRIGEPLQKQKGVIAAIAFSPDGKYLASGSQDNSIILWNVNTQEPIGEPLTGHSEAVISLDFSPDGKMIASGGEDGKVIFWDVQTREMIGDPITTNSQIVYTVAFSPDGKELATGGTGKTVILWDTTTHTEIGKPMVGQSETISKIEFSPDGKKLASGSVDNSIIIWNPATQEQISTLHGHNEAVLSLAFSADGEMLASGSVDHSTILWNMTDLNFMQTTLPQNDSDIWAVAVSPDGKTLASGDADGSILLWDMSTGEKIGNPLLGHSKTVAVWLSARMGNTWLQAAQIRRSSCGI